MSASRRADARVGELPLLLLPLLTEPLDVDDEDEEDDEEEEEEEEGGSG